jgi:hypothetical protein
LLAGERAAPERLNDMRKRSVIITLGVVAFAFALILFVKGAKHEAELTKTISWVRYVTGCLQHYVKEEGSFPESLEAVISAGYMDSEFMDHFFPGVEVVYQKPIEGADVSFSVLEVRFEGRTILVNKEFERSVIR